MLKIAICDDNFEYVKSVLFDYVRSAVKCSYTDCKPFIFTNGNNLLNSYCNGNHFDIVILDIEMPMINGKDLASKLRELDHSFFLIFVTTYPQEVFDTFKYKVNAFIPKNSSSDFFISELSRVIREYSEYSQNFEIIEILRSGCLTVTKLPLNNIFAFQFRDHNIYLKTAFEESPLKETIFKKVSERYVSKGFFECSRNYLVNVNRIKEISTGSLLLTNGDMLPVSRRSYKPLLAAFNQHIMSEVEE